MAGSLNKVILMGNLTRDVELRPVGETQVGNFGLAINNRYRTRSGEDREETTFVDCELWGARAEAMGRYLSKGSPVLVEGRLKLDQWQDKDGGNRSKLKVVVDNFQFIDSRGGGGGGGNQGGGGGYSNAGGGNQGGGYSNNAPQDNYQPVTDDEIPF